MKVFIKQFDVEMEIKSKGIELEVRTPDGKTQLGDLVVKKTGLVWCKGRTSAKNGITINWNKFIEFAENK